MSSDARFALAFSTAMAVVVGLLAVIITSYDETQWVHDGNCYIRVHDEARILWVPDTRTVTRYCEVSD